MAAALHSNQYGWCRQCDHEWPCPTARDEADQKDKAPPLRHKQARIQP